MASGGRRGVGKIDMRLSTTAVEGRKGKRREGGGREGKEASELTVFYGQLVSLDRVLDLKIPDELARKLRVSVSTNLLIPSSFSSEIELESRKVSRRPTSSLLLRPNPHRFALTRSP